MNIISRMAIAVNDGNAFMIVSTYIYLKSRLLRHCRRVYALRRPGRNGLSLLRLREVEPGENYRPTRKEKAGDLLMEEEPSEEGGEGRVEIYER